MGDENPFEVPATLDRSNEPRLSLLEQLAVFVTTLIAVVFTFFVTCFGSVMLGDALGPTMRGNSMIPVAIGMILIIGVPLLSSAWVLSTVRRTMANALLEKKKAAMKKDEAGP
ncbi:MAG: hypothetical protein JNM43_20395 [Planctomycetaceae bacterium]|nr:hypothetical protein [Planctomycetaceae bacterium]